MNFKKIAAFGLGVMMLGLSFAAPAQAAVDRAVVVGVVNPDYTHIDFAAVFMDGATPVETYGDEISAAGVYTQSDVTNWVKTSIKNYAATAGYTAIASGNHISLPFSTQSDIDSAVASATSSVTAAYTSAITAAIPAGPSSYQTIVSQTGTAAPAVAGGMTPVNNYSGTPTFTWARTGTGVYTLTASSAVFNTSGKTGVFITPPQNLNGSFRAVVTSSTVITVTTAVQSLAVLGLLGFTATPTDALLSGTMVYVQTYP